jgi:hypothetical protein
VHALDVEQIGVPAEATPAYLGFTMANHILGRAVLTGPHQSREQRPPLHEPGQTIDLTARVERRQVVHCLISEYRRAA